MDGQDLNISQYLYQLASAQGQDENETTINIHCNNTDLFL